MNKYLTRSALCTAMLVVVMSGCTLTEIKCPGKIDCAGECSDLMTDDKNCGACGTVCKDGEKCIEGMCQLSCPENQVDCGGRCVGLENDSKHCGGCDIVCKEGEKCQEGACVISCPSDQIECTGKCVDLRMMR